MGIAVPTEDSGRQHHQAITRRTSSTWPTPELLSTSQLFSTPLATTWLASVRPRLRLTLPSSTPVLPESTMLPLLWLPLLWLPLLATPRTDLLLMPMVPGPQTTPQPRRSLPPPTLPPRESTLSSTLDFTLESVRLRPSPMPGAMATVFPTPTEVPTPAHTMVTTLVSVMPKPSPMPGAMVSPTELVSTAHTPPMAVTTTLESVTLKPSLMPGATMVSPTEVFTAHTPMAVSATLESVMPRLSPMPGAIASPLPTEVSTAHTLPMAVTTLESAMLRLSPGATTVSPREVSTEDGPMSTKEELLSSGLNCDTIKNLPRRIIQLPVLWIPKKLKVQNEYLLHIATA